MPELFIEKYWRLLPAPWRAFFGAVVFGAVLSLGVVLCPLDAKSDSETTEKLETAFIFQFTNYIEWPANNAEYFVISVLGEDDLLPYLEELEGKKLVKGKEIQVLFAKDLSQLKKSQIVVVHAGDENLLRQLSQKNQGALIVSHSEGFAEKGAMINFFEDAERLRFEINRRALEEQGLVISSQLLKLARIIE